MFGSLAAGGHVSGFFLSALLAVSLLTFAGKYFAFLLQQKIFSIRGICALISPLFFPEDKRLLWPAWFEEGCEVWIIWAKTWDTPESKRRDCKQPGLGDGGSRPIGYPPSLVLTPSWVPSHVKDEGLVNVHMCVRHPSDPCPSSSRGSFCSELRRSLLWLILLYLFLANLFSEVWDDHQSCQHRFSGDSKSKGTFFVGDVSALRFPG